MHSILRTSDRLDLLPSGGRVAPRPAEFDTFVVDDRTGLTAARASVRVDVCPLTKAIAGFGISFDPASSARPTTVAAPERARKRKTGPRKAGTWPLSGLPRTVMIDCPEFAAPTLRDAVIKSGEPVPDPEG